MSRRPEDLNELLQREVERLWRDLVYHRHPSTHFTPQPWSPPVDVVVSEDAARVIFELAGVPRDAVKVVLRGSTLEVSGRRVPPRELGEVYWHRAEIYFGEFRRVVELPWEADEKKITATYREGMLEIHLQPAAQTHPTDVSVEGRSA